MKVYCVWAHYYYEGDVLLGIFDTEEKAQQQLEDSKKNQYCVDRFEVTEEEVK